MRVLAIFIALSLVVLGCAAPVPSPTTASASLAPAPSIQPSPAPSETPPGAPSPFASPSPPSATPTATPSALPSQSSFGPASPAPSAFPSGRPTFSSVEDAYRQTPNWQPCGSSGVDATCTFVYVPTNYEQPDAGTTAIAVVRFRASGKSQGDLFVNPGGPGVGGISLAASLATSPLGQTFDIIGFDPRGTGNSDPLVCLGTSALDQLMTFDPTPDTPATRQEGIDLVTAQGQACATNSGLLAAHVTTIETARDLDVLRAVRGDEKMNYLGFSYGTILGDTYAALFPDRVGRFVLDGPLVPGLSQSEIAEAQTRGLQRELDDYIAACVKTLGQCPLGSSVDKATAKLRHLLVAVDTKPLPTDDPARPLNQALAFFGVVETLYSPTNWWLLSDALRRALAGNGQPLLTLADLYLGRNGQGYTSNATQANQAISCLDQQVAGGPTVIPESTFLADSPLIGDIMYGLADRGCGDWPPRTTLTPPDYSAPGTPPILVVGTTRDPVTPYFWAKQLTKILDNGFLLTRVGDGHTAYESGNKCIVNKVDAFLVDGALPATGTRC